MLWRVLDGSTLVTIIHVYNGGRARGLLLSVRTNIMRKVPNSQHQTIVYLCTLSPQRLSWLTSRLALHSLIHHVPAHDARGALEFGLLRTGHADHL